MISHDGKPQYEDYWPVLRESQRLAAATPNTAMVVTIDVGDPKDLHPPVKKPIADRLVLAAKKLAYGEDLVISGPMIDSAKLQGEKVVLSFTNKGSGLMIGAADKDFKVSEAQGTPANFELTGKDGTFVPAQAAIEGDTVLVWSDAIKAPTAVRYAWKDNPEPPVNLYNREGLPASPFTVVIEVENLKR
jgi:sialate O-acetylesterase